MMAVSRYARRPVALAVALMLGVLLLPFIANLLSGSTLIRITKLPNSIYAEVDGARLDIPAATLDQSQANKLTLPSSSAELRVGSQSSSAYWQPAQGNPFVQLGQFSEWLQKLRPMPEWTGARLESSSGEYTLHGGRTPASMTLATADGNGYEFVIQPEKRSISWWRLEESQAVEQLASASYRPSGLASLGDMIAELLLIFQAAALFALAALGISVLLRWLPGRGEAPVVASQAPGPLRRWLSRPYQPAIALFLGATVLTAAVCLSVLDGIPHVQDDVAYIFQGKIFALGKSAVPIPPGPEFFQNGFILMFDGRWFTKYPPGFPLMLVPGLWAGIPWLINPLSAGVSLALIYATGLHMYGRHVAVWAALIGLLSPWVLFMSGSYMSHPTTMMWVALFIYCLVRMRDSPAPTQNLSTLRTRRLFLLWPLLGGFAMGMAFITREWTALGIGVGAALWALGDILLSHKLWRRKVLRYALVVAGFAPPLLFLLYENRQLTGDWFRFAQDLVGSYDAPGFGPGHGDATIGHTPAMGVYNTLVYLRTLATLFDGWPAPLALAPLLLGLFAWTHDKKRQHLYWDLLLWLGWAGLVGAYFLWWSSTTIFGPRYWYEGTPFLLLMAGRGMDLLGTLVAPRLKGAWRLQARWLVPGILFAFLSLYNLTQALPYQVSQYRDYNDISAAALRSTEKAALKSALVFVELDPARSNRDYGKVFFANDPLLKGNIVYARDLGAARNRGLVALFPGRTPYWLPLNGPPQPGVGK
ncbi:MAG: hypothetical protein IVW55_00700 [Chloroflexi bacterium]|nr:hypothetical protein [Chloroflexota bacterium]